MASLKPPFNLETATKKVKAAQDLWNTKFAPPPHLPCIIQPRFLTNRLLKIRDLTKIASAYTPDTIWRNRTTFLSGTSDITNFLTAKFQKEQSYRLRKELFAFTENRIAVQFWYEYRDGEDGRKWKRCYGLEDWTFNEDGKMRKRMMSGNDLVLGVSGDGEGRWFVDGVDVDEVRIEERHW